MNDEEAPAKTPERYGQRVLDRSKINASLVQSFFKDNVQRAKDRNVRYVEIGLQASAAIDDEMCFLVGVTDFTLQIHGARCVSTRPQRFRK